MSVQAGKHNLDVHVGSKGDNHCGVVVVDFGMSPHQLEFTVLSVVGCCDEWLVAVCIEAGLAHRVALGISEGPTAGAQVRITVTLVHVRLPHDLVAAVNPEVHEVLSFRIRRSQGQDVGAHRTWLGRSSTLRAVADVTGVGRIRFWRGGGRINVEILLQHETLQHVAVEESVQAFLEGGLEHHLFELHGVGDVAQPAKKVQVQRSSFLGLHYEQGDSVRV